jgi:hypothetical protein
MPNGIKLFYPVEPFKFPITQRFGENPQWYPLTNGHNGIDWGVPLRTPIYATLPGTISKIASDPNGYGNHIRISHDGNLLSIYGHLDEQDYNVVGVNDAVQTGQQIGFSGNTGRSTGPHLHFEVRMNNHAYDPEPYLTTDKAKPKALFKVRVLETSKPFVNVRSGPGVLYPVVDKLTPGTEIEVYEIANDTIWLQTPAGFIAMTFNGKDLAEIMAQVEE